MQTIPFLNTDITFTVSPLPVRSDGLTFCFGRRSFEDPNSSRRFLSERSCPMFVIKFLELRPIIPTLSPNSKHKLRRASQMHSFLAETLHVCSQRQTVGACANQRHVKINLLDSRAHPVQRIEPRIETLWIFRNRLHRLERLERERRKHSWIVKKNLTLFILTSNAGLEGMNHQHRTSTQCGRPWILVIVRFEILQTNGFRLY